MNPGPGALTPIQCWPADQPVPFQLTPLAEAALAAAQPDEEAGMPDQITDADGTVHTIQAAWPGHGYIVTSAPPPEPAPAADGEATLDLPQPAQEAQAG